MTNLKDKIEWLENNCLQFTIDYNDHKTSYHNVEEEIKQYDLHEFISEEQKRKCIENDRMWCIQVYPITPSGFIHVCGYDFELCLDKAIEETKEYLDD